MKNKSLIIIQNKLPHYRRDFFNSLTRIADVVLIHSGPVTVREEDNFKEIIIPSYKFGPFNIQLGIFKLIKKLKPNVIIASADIRNFMSLAAMYNFDRRIKWVWWGLDIGSTRIATLFKILIFKRNNPIIFYNESIKKIFIDFGLKKENLFVANNTFVVQDSISLADELPKDIFINVGSLDPRKQNDILIKIIAHYEA